MLVDKIPVFMGKMFEKGILFLNDIVNCNGRVMSFVELYGKVCSFQEYNQLITALPQKWRRRVAAGGGRELVCLPNIKDLEWLRDSCGGILEGSGIHKIVIMKKETVTYFISLSCTRTLTHKDGSVAERLIHV